MTARTLKVFIGWDKREPEAYAVARYSLYRRTSIPVLVEPLVEEALRSRGLFWRPTEFRDGRLWDVISDAPQSTAFATTRFLSPLLCSNGWALFTDCDMVYLDDIAKLLDSADDRYAVMVVPHDHRPSETIKMDNQIQTTYQRKNWSSVMLFNCEHSSNRERLTLDLVNSVPGRDLHRFCWLSDDEIGFLDRRWNWLVEVQPEPDSIGIAHYTLGGPWFKDREPRPTDHHYNRELAVMQADEMGVVSQEFPI